MKNLAMIRSNRSLERKIACLAVTMAFVPFGYAQEDAEAMRELTQVSSHVELGIGYVGKDSWKFGEYNGLSDKGSYLIGNIGLRALDVRTAKWWSLTGTNLGLSSRNLRFDAGTQGSYRVWAEYDQLEKLGNDTVMTLFNGAGGNTLSLPAGFAGIATTDTTQALRAAKVDPFLQRLELSQERQNYIVGASGLLGGGWDVGANFRHEKKDGIKLIGGVFGNSGGNPRASVLPEPVDYVTNQFELALGYAGEKSQFKATYYLSLFSNNNDSLVWQNPYMQIGGWTAANAGFPNGIGQLALPPDNAFHQLGVSGGYNLTQTTRLGYNLAIGRMTQDESFLPYAVTPGIVINTPLPRSSLDGKVNTTLAGLNFSSRVLPRLTLRGSYRHDDRDDRTPQAQYRYIGGDSQSPQSGVATDRARTNLPLSYTQNLLKLDADYRVFTGTKLNAGYDYDQIRRKFTEVDKTKEHTARIGARRTIADNVTGGITYAHSRRRNDGYNGTAPFEQSYSPEYRATLPAGTAFDNNPLMRKFTYADRDRDKVKLNVSASPHEKVTLGLGADYYQDDFKSDKNSLIGLQEAKGATYTLDAAFTPVEKITTYAYYTHDNYKSQQQSRQFNSAQKLDAATDGPNLRDWFVNVDNEADSIGLGFKTTGFRGRLDFGADLIYTESTGHIDPVAATTALTALPLPDNRTRLTSLLLFAKYQIQKNGWVRLSFLHQKYRESDWAWDNVTPTTMANVISTGQQPPDYSVAAVGVSFIYRYW